jgi:hypothetical protein
MTCPHCGAPRTWEDRVCRKCRYCFEEGRIIEVHPQRASSRPRRGAIVLWQIGIGVAALVPGFGHLLKLQIFRGLCLFAAVGSLQCLSLAFHATLAGQLLFGAAVSAHALSILDVTPWRRSDGPIRGVAMAGLLAVLMMAYWPLVMHLVNDYGEHRYGRRRNRSC